MATFDRSQHWDELLTRLPASAPDILSTARAMEYRGDLDGATRLLDAAVNRHPNQDLRSMLGTVLIKQQRFPEALAALIEILKTHPEHQPTLLLVCECLIECYEFERATTLLARAAAAGPGHPRLANLRQLLDRRKKESAHGHHPTDPALDTRLNITTADNTTVIPTDEPTGVFIDERALDVAFSRQTMEALAHVELASNAPTQVDSLPMGRAMLQQPAPQQESDKTVVEANVLTAIGAHPSTPSTFSTKDLPTLAASPAELGLLSNSELLVSAQPEHDNPTRALSDDHFAPTSTLEAHHADTREDLTALAPHTIPEIPGLVAPAGVEPIHQANDEPTSLWAGKPKMGTELPSSNMDAIPFDTVPSLQANPHLIAPGDSDGSDIQFASASLLANIEDVEASDLQVGPSPAQLAAVTDPNIRSSGFTPLQPRHPAAAPLDASESFSLPAASDAPSFGARPVPVGPARQAPRQVHPASLQDADEAISLDYAALEKTSKPATQHEPQPQPRASARQAPALDSTSPSSSSSQLGKRAAFAALALLGSAAIAGALVYTADSSLTTALRAKDELAVAELAKNSHQGHARAIELLTDASATASFLGPGLDSSLLEGTLPLPGLESHSIKRDIAARLALASVVMAHDYTGEAAPNTLSLIKTSQELGSREETDVAALLYTRHTAPNATLEKATNAHAAYPSNALIAAILAYEYARHAQISRAHELLDKIDTSGADTHALRLIAEAAARSNHEKAQQLYDELTAALPGESAERAIASASGPQTDDVDHRDAKAALDKHELAKLPACTRARAAVNESTAARARGQLDVATRAISRATSLCPRAPHAASIRADLLLQQGDVDKLEGMIASKPTPLTRHDVAELRTRHALATLDTTRALEHASDLADWPHQLTYYKAHAAMLDFDALGAAKLFEESEKEETRAGTARANYVLALTTAAPMRAKSLAEQLDKMLEERPNQPELLRAAAWTSALRAINAKDRSAREDLFANAHSLLSKEISLAAHDPAPHLAQCELQLLRGMIESARTSCDNAAKLGPLTGQARATLANLALYENNTDDALAHTRQLLEVAPKSLRARHQHVRALLAARQLGDARTLLEGLPRELPPETRAAFDYQYGMLEFHSGSLDTATKRFDAVLATQSHHTGARIMLAYTRIRQGKTTQAEAILKKHLSDHIHGGMAWLALGELRANQKRSKDAETNLKKAATKLAATSQDRHLITEAYTRHAEFIQQTSGWSDPRVASLLDKAEENSPASSADYHHARAAVLLAQPSVNWRVAVEHLQAAIASSPDHCRSLEKLIKIGQEQGLQVDTSAHKKALEEHCGG